VRIYFLFTVIELVTNKKLRFGTSLINSILTREFFFLSGENRRKQEKTGGEKKMNSLIIV
jgi:hypothetical protein